MKKYLFMIALGLFLMPLTAQNDSSDETTDKKEEKIKSGWTFGGVPVVAYDTDVGFKYGALVNLYDFGDGSRYPAYDNSIYVEWSRTTKGSGINMLTWESNKLIPGIRSFFETSLLTEQALDFYGFNGAQSIYSADWKNSINDDGTANRLFYRHARQLLRIKGDFQGEIVGNKFRWLAGIAYYGHKISAVDVDKLNEGKTEDLLSDQSLYNNYIDWGIIKDDQKEGGAHTLLKGGLVFDTRDNEPNPYKGVWTEMQLHYAPSFLSNTNYGYGRLIFTHRQYFTIVPDWINFAYRASYQGKIFGEMPFYMMPLLFNTAPKNTSDGVGGSKTVRGIMRNRIVGEGFAYGNAEVRAKVLKTQFLKQNLYIALSAFVDAGMVTQKYELPDDLIATFPEAATYIDLDAKEVPHIGYGAGVHFVLNQNFIIAVDYGFAANANDGSSGLYIGLNFLY
jgi:hypothetical protein